ncbi:hypothetical protein OAU44_00270 [bacterium]|nr:hypothetical protein [bacterium]
MPVDEDIDLNKPLTDAQIRKLEREAEKLEKAAEKAERAAEKINNEMRQASASLLEAEKFMGTGPLAGMGGNDEFESTASNFLGIGGKSVDELGMSKGRRSGSSWSGTSTAGIDNKVLEETAKLERDANSAKIKKLMEEQNKIKLEQKEQQQHNAMIVGRVSGGQQKLNQAFSFKRNPIGSIQNKVMGMMGKAGPYGAIAAIAIMAGEQIYNQVMNEIKDLYKAGGALDVRKDTLNALAQVSSIDTVIDNEQGRVFFTSSTGEILRQGVPQDYNTRGKINGYKQYLQEFDR